MLPVLQIRIPRSSSFHFPIRKTKMRKNSREKATEQILCTESPDVQKNPMAACYARHCLPNRERIESQLLQNARQAEADGYCLPDDAEHRFADDGASGRNVRRAGFQRLMKMIAAGHAPFTRLYMTDRTRLGRWNDPRRHAVWERLCKEHGVEIRYGPEGATEPCRDHAGRQELLAAIERSLAQRMMTRRIRKRRACL